MSLSDDKTILFLNTCIVYMIKQQNLMPLNAGFLSY